MAIKDIGFLTRPIGYDVGGDVKPASELDQDKVEEKRETKKRQIRTVQGSRAAGMTADEQKKAAERGDFGEVGQKLEGIDFLSKRLVEPLDFDQEYYSPVDRIDIVGEKRPATIIDKAFKMGFNLLDPRKKVKFIKNIILGTPTEFSKNLMLKGDDVTESIVDKLPQVNVKVKAGTKPDLSKLETIGTDGKIYVNINNKPVLKEDAIIKKTVLGEAGRNPRDQYRYAVKTGVGKFINPEQDTFLINIVKRRLEEGVPYTNLRGSIQEYIKRDPDLLKQAEELELLDFSNQKIQDRLKGIFRGTVKNVSDENLKTINYIKNAKTEQWHNIKQFTGFSEEGSKQAHDIKNQIVLNLPGNIRDQARKNLTMNIDRMAKFAVRSGATEADVLKTLAKVDVDELAKIQAERITIQSRINLANKLGIDVDKANLSHKADVLKNWKLTLQSDNLFFAGAKANQQIQVAVNKEIDDLIAELGAVEFRRLRLGTNVSKQEKEIAKKIKELEQTLIDNDLISVVQGEKMGAKELVDDPRFTKKILESVDNKILNRLQEVFGLELDKVDPKEIEKLIKQEISTKMFGDPAYFKKDGGIMSIEEIIQEPIRSKYTS